MNGRIACALGICLVAGLAWGQAAAPAAVEPTAQQIGEWKTQEDALDNQVDAIRDRIEKLPEAVELRKARDAADRAYYAKKGADPAYAAAGLAEQEAKEARKALIKAQVAAKPEGKTLLDEIASVQDGLRQVDYEQDVVELALEHDDSPLNRAIDSDPDIQKLEAAYEAANDAYGRDRALKPQRDAARQALRDAREAKTRALPEGKLLLEQLAALEKQEEALDKTEDELDDKLDDMEDAIKDGDDPEIKAAKAREDAAEEQRKHAYNGDGLVAARQARDAARQAYDEKLKALFAADPDGPRLKQERDALRERIRKAE